jgi:hypothetical protein
MRFTTVMHSHHFMPWPGHSLGKFSPGGCGFSNGLTGQILKMSQAVQYDFLADFLPTTSYVRRSGYFLLDDFPMFVDS